MGENRRIITVLDLETGSLDHNSAPIMEVAALSFYLDNLAVVDEYSAFIRPYGGLEIDPIVYQKTTVTPQDVANGKDHKVVVKELIQYFKNVHDGSKNGSTILLGHNIVGFDRLFLEYLFLLNGVDIYDHISKEFIDTLPRSREFWSKEEKHNLGAACKRAGVTLVGAHGAVADVRANYDLYCYFVKMQRNGVSNGSKNSEKQEEDYVKRKKYFEF